MIKLNEGYNKTENMGELQWGGHVGWPYALMVYLFDWVMGHRPNLVVCYASWQNDWFVMYHNKKGKNEQIAKSNPHDNIKRENS